MIQSPFPISVSFVVGARKFAGLVLLLAAVSLSACATRPPASDPAAVAAFEENNDRFEPLNRDLFKVDAGLQKVFVRPVVKTYRFLVPAPARRGILNFEHNLHSPVTFIHDILQGSPRRGAETFGRLVINTTMGFFGFFDVATKLGIPYHSEDLGQTLAVWGVADGSYIYVPLFGPTTIRDGIGLGIDVFFTDPLSWYERGRHHEGWVEWADLGAFYVSTMDDNMDALDELKKSAIDPYAALRSAYRQYRGQEIRNGAPPPLEDFDAPP